MQRNSSMVAVCGSPYCAGCYEIIHPDTGDAVKIHPPKTAQERRLSTPTDSPNAHSIVITDEDIPF